jgi:hypothetical protein
MQSPFKVVIDREKHLGASFIEKDAVAHVRVIQDVVYAKPGVKALKIRCVFSKGSKRACRAS